MNYRENILSKKPTQLPVYNDGNFLIYEINQTKDVYPKEFLKLVKKENMWFKELSISNNLKFEAEQRNIKITMKIRIPQTKEIDSLTVLKIGNNYHKVYNAYHFTNSEGFKETDLTLVEYINAIVEEKNE